MKILERYIFTEFAKLLTIAVLAFIMLFIMVDLFENMDNLMKFHVPLTSGLAFFAYKIPFIITQVSPVAVLVAVLLSLGILAKHGEITAMKAGGVRLLRTVMPLLFSGLLISVAIILLNEYVAPGALKKVDAFRKQWFGAQGSSFGKEGVWVRTGNGIFNIRQVDLKKNQLHGVTLYVVEKPFKIKSRVYARQAVWQGEQWVASSAFVWAFTGTGEAGGQEVKNLTLEGLVEPADLVNVENLQKNMSFNELKNYIKGLEADGYDSSRYRIDLYGKVSFPLVNFIMVLVGIPFALKTGRHSGIAAGVGLSIVIAFSYWIVYALMRSLGQGAILPPFIAAVFPDLLFLAIGALMFGYVRQ